ncbi:MAG: GNAT family N-acetyltransferase [Spirochaetes bacterium]|nr:GNAT family N-acetyltransferase [Spirochaetota bacterium]
MKWERYGITLHRLTPDKLELVRNWRNDPKISQYMFFKDYITPEMQLEWFNRINNDSNYYFIIEYNKQEIGLANTKDIDKEKKCGEGGIFIYEDEYLNSDIPFRVSFCGSDFDFEELKLDYKYARIVAGNKRAVQFNKALGYEIKASEDGDSILATLTKENYYKQRNRYIQILL